MITRGAYRLKVLPVMNHTVLTATGIRTHRLNHSTLVPEISAKRTGCEQQTLWLCRMPAGDYQGRSREVRPTTTSSGWRHPETAFPLTSLESKLVSLKLA
jgi:hypothetical protein